MPMPDVDPEKVVPADDVEVLAGDEDEEEKDTLLEEEEKPEGEEEEEKPEEEEKETAEEPDLGPRRPSFKEIKEKFPELFKTFPDLREAFFRESEYTKVFPTVDDAKEAANDLESLSVIRDKVLAGDFSTILESSRDADPASYNKLVDNMLPALYKLDQDAYMRALTPPVENMVRLAYKEGISSNNEDLQNSALHIAKWFFGDEDVATGKATTVRKSNEPSEESKALAKEREQFEATKFRDALNSVIVDRDSVLEKEILKGLDSDNELSSYVRNKLVKDVIDEIDKQVQKDGSHMSLMNSRWRRAKAEGYSKDSLQRIVSTYQSRARFLIPSIRARLKEAALGKPTKKEVGAAAAVAGRKEMPVGVPASVSERLPNPKHIDWRATSDEDILAGNIKTRR